MTSYVVTVHHETEYRQIEVYVAVEAGKDPAQEAVRRVENLGAPGPWRASNVRETERADA